MAPTMSNLLETGPLCSECTWPDFSMPVLCQQAAQHLKPDAQLLQPPPFTEVREGQPSKPEAPKPTEPAHKKNKKKFFSQVGSHKCLRVQKGDIKWLDHALAALRCVVF